MASGNNIAHPQVVSLLKIVCMGSEEMAQMLRVLSAFPGDLGSIPSTTWQLTPVCNSGFKASDVFTQTYLPLLLSTHYFMFWQCLCIYEHPVYGISLVVPILGRPRCLSYFHTQIPQSSFMLSIHTDIHGGKTLMNIG